MPARTSGPVDAEWKNHTGQLEISVRGGERAQRGLDKMQKGKSLDIPVANPQCHPHRCHPQIFQLVMNPSDLDPTTSDLMSVL